MKPAQVRSKGSKGQNSKKDKGIASLNKPWCLACVYLVLFSIQIEKKSRKGPLKKKKSVCFQFSLKSVLEEKK